MTMVYKYYEDGEKLCRCPECGWTGKLHDTEGYEDAGLPRIQICPKCINEVPVEPVEEAPED